MSLSNIRTLPVATSITPNTTAAGCALTPLVRMPMSYWRVAG